MNDHNLFTSPYDSDDYDDSPDEEEVIRTCYYFDGGCEDYARCMYYGCYHQGMWQYPKASKDAPDPEF